MGIKTCHHLRKFSFKAIRSSILPGVGSLEGRGNSALLRKFFFVFARERDARDVFAPPKADEKRERQSFSFSSLAERKRTSIPEIFATSKIPSHELRCQERSSENTFHPFRRSAPAVVKATISSRWGGREFHGRTQEIISWVRPWNSQTIYSSPHLTLSGGHAKKKFSIVNDNFCCIAMRYYFYRRDA